MRSFFDFLVRVLNSGTHAMHVTRLDIDCRDPLPLALDGEVTGALPGTFDVLGGALHVITPTASRRRFRRAQWAAAPTRSGDGDRPHIAEPGREGSLEGARIAPSTPLARRFIDG
jgi:hypothetical protein